MKLQELREQAVEQGRNANRIDKLIEAVAKMKQEIACARFFFNGGMVFEPWMEKALELVDGSQFEKADVICVSDGISNVSMEAQAEWTRRRAERGIESNLSANVTFPDSFNLLG